MAYRMSRSGTPEIGRWWRQVRPAAAALALALPFVSEPGLWNVRSPGLQQHWAVWSLEVALGLLTLFVLLRARSEHRLSHHR